MKKQQSNNCFVVYKNIISYKIKKKSESCLAQKLNFGETQSNKNNYNNNM